MVPQIEGGAIPPGFVTEKMSVRHWVWGETPTPPFRTVLPFKMAVVVMVEVDGPAIMNWLKSRRS